MNTTSSMSNEQIVSQVNDLMHTGFEIPRDKLVPTATLFDDLGMDSLDAIDMLVHLEEKLQIKVEGERLKKVRTLADIYGLVGEVAIPSLQPQSEQSH
ncbi:MAG: acyl carrier protein [Deltaproteobacteria bacterium]|nr:acyl carrier protein [Deltaproteobacteria bacterium]